MVQKQEEFPQRFTLQIAGSYAKILRVRSRATRSTGSSPVKSNRIINVENRNISISDYAKQLPPEAYKIIEVDDKKYRMFSKVVKLSEIGKVRIVISYDLEKPETDPFLPLIVSPGKRRK